MTTSILADLSLQPFDVVILGGAFSGSSLGILLLREFPNLKVAVVEKSQQFDRKVGESTSEVGACFLTKVLNLGDYLPFEHVMKQGLRMWFSQNREDSVDDCSELGPRFQSRLPGYQLDRSKLDSHLLRELAELGATILRPVSVREIELPQEGASKPGKVTIKDNDGATAVLSAPWIIDASGKASLLGRQRKTLKVMEDAHPTSSMWCRFGNVTSLESDGARKQFPSLQEKVLTHRGLATNHLSGYGWWSWIIPLKNGDHSLGLTWDRRLFSPPDADGTVPGKLKEHIMTHPVGRLMFEHAIPNEKDARQYKNLAYMNTEVAGPGWAVCGDAAGFMDPLYSQGLDFCAHTVYAVFDMLRHSFRDECHQEALEKYKTSYPMAYQRWFDALYRDKYHYIGDAELMNVAFLLDLATYFLGPVKFVYEDTDKEFAQLPFHGPAGAGIAKFMAFYNKRLTVHAKKRQAAGTYGAKNISHCYLISKGFAPGLASMSHLRQGLMAWLKVEVKGLFSRSSAPLKRAPVMKPQPETG